MAVDDSYGKWQLIFNAGKAITSSSYEKLDRLTQSTAHFRPASFNMNRFPGHPFLSIVTHNLLRRCSMKVRYCEKYEKYVSIHHCEFFNNGKACEFRGNISWNRIKDLQIDSKRPKEDVSPVAKPFKCSLDRLSSTYPGMSRSDRR